MLPSERGGQGLGRLRGLADSRESQCTVLSQGDSVETWDALIEVEHPEQRR